MRQESFQLYFNNNKKFNEKGKGAEKSDDKHKTEFRHFLYLSNTTPVLHLGQGMLQFQLYQNRGLISEENRVPVIMIIIFQ